MCLAGAVQDVADEAAGEHAVDTLGDRAERPGQAEAAGDDLREFLRSGGDQPYLLAGVEVALCQSPCAGPDLVGDVLVVDLPPRSINSEVRRPEMNESAFLAALCDVVGVLLAGDLELGLRPHHIEDVAVPKVVVRHQATSEVHDRGAVHECVVDVEECGRGEITGTGGAFGTSASVVRSPSRARSESTAASALASPARR